MREGKLANAIGASLTAVVFIGISAHADTIVLKNGRRIVASSVTDANGKISYETPAGEMSIPKSSVDHVERDDFAYTPAAKAAVRASIAAPATQPVRGY